MAFVRSYTTVARYASRPLPRIEEPRDARRLAAQLAQLAARFQRAVRPLREVERAVRRDLHDAEGDARAWLQLLLAETADDLGAARDGAREARRWARELRVARR